MKPKIKEIFKDYLKPFNGETVFHMGSTAIKGMPGSGGLDISIVTEGILPDVPEHIIQEVKEKLGYEFCGPTPHCMDKNLDQWFKMYDGKNMGTIHMISLK